MTSYRNFISASFGLFFLAQCRNGKHDDPAQPILMFPVKEQLHNSPIGVWKYNSTIFYDLDLTLHSDGTFKFHDQGCTGQRFTQGKWTNNNGIILLTSFPAYRRSQIAEIKTPNEEVVHVKEKFRKKNRMGVYSFDGVKYMSSPTFPGPGDTVKIYFDNIPLQLKNDTLNSIGVNKLPENARLSRSGKKS